VQEARRALGRGTELPSYAALTALAAEAPAFTAFIDPDDARFLRHTDLPAAVRALCAETDQPLPTTDGHVVRVILESLALKYADVTRHLEQLTGKALTHLHVVGGGSGNDVLCQLTADATGLPVVAGPIEATTIGNLIVQALALGELASLTQARELVARSFPTRHYEPSGDWSDARNRFQQLVQGIPV
jgi:rhamnulokinase